jgi:hypothetical protein
VKTAPHILASRPARIVIAVLALCAIVDWIRPQPAWSQPAKIQSADVRSVGLERARSAKEFVLELGPVAFSLRVKWPHRG